MKWGFSDAILVTDWKTVPATFHFISTDWNLAIPEKNKWGERGGWGHTFLKAPLEYFISLLYPWIFQTKQSSTPSNSTKLY